MVYASAASAHNSFVHLFRIQLAVARLWWRVCRSAAEQMLELLLLQLLLTDSTAVKPTLPRLPLATSLPRTHTHIRARGSTHTPL